MIQAKVYPVTAIGTNCCYLTDEATGRHAVLDPGAKSAELLKKIDSDGGALDYVLLTHGHYDHICFAKELADLYGAKIVTGKHNAPFLRDPSLNLTAKHGIPFEPFEADILLEDGESFFLGETEIRYLYTPGHTSGCGVFLMGELMLSGDLLFRESYGRTDLPTGDDFTIIQSLKRLKELDGDYVVVPGHGPVTTLAYERKRNPIMRRLS